MLIVVLSRKRLRVESSFTRCRAMKVTLTADRRATRLVALQFVKRFDSRILDMMAGAFPAVWGAHREIEKNGGTDAARVSNSNVGMAITQACSFAERFRSSARLTRLARVAKSVSRKTLRRR